jgi:hypothetical protein
MEKLVISDVHRQLFFIRFKEVVFLTQSMNARNQLDLKDYVRERVMAIMQTRGMDAMLL